MTMTSFEETTIIYVPASIWHHTKALYAKTPEILVLRHFESPSVRAAKVYVMPPNDEVMGDLAHLERFILWCNEGPLTRVKNHEDCHLIGLNV